MNDKITLLATGILTLFFFVTGLLDLLGHFMVKTVLFALFFSVVVNIILVKSKDEDKNNLPN